MRFSRIILAAVIFLAAAFYPVLTLRSSYLRFTGKDSAYYRPFADACDSLLQSHPVGSNDWVYRRGVRLPGNSIQLPVKDPSLPNLIRALEPEKIILSSNRLFIGVGVGRGAFGITWAQDKGPNGWSLRTYAENLEKTHYETTKFHF